MATLIPFLPKLDPATEQKVEGVAAGALVAAIDAAGQYLINAQGAIDWRQVAIVAAPAAWLVVRRGLLSLFQAPVAPPSAVDQALTGGALPTAPTTTDPAIAGVARLISTSGTLAAPVTTTPISPPPAAPPTPGLVIAPSDSPIPPAAPDMPPHG